VAITYKVTVFTTLVTRVGVFMVIQTK